MNNKQPHPDNLNANESGKPRSSRTTANADPILLELWEIKRQINAEAHFDVALLAAQANQFDLQKTLQKLRAAH